MKQIYILIFLLINSFLYSQNLEKLQENNGFRKIKLNTTVEDYVDEKNLYEFVKKDSTTLEYFEHFNYDYIYAGSEYEKIGETKILRIFVNTFNDLIYEIYIVLEKNWDISETTQLAYGKPTYKSTDLESFDYTWITKGREILCNVKGSDSHNYFQLIYTDIDLRNKAWDEKHKKEKNKAIKEF